MSDFDIAAFCETSDGGAGSAACSVLTTTDSMATGIDTFFLLFAGAAVFLMQAGFAMLCAGSVRQKNVKNIMLKNLLDACGGALGFYILGYGISYGGEGTFIGSAGFALANFRSGPDYIGWFFQFAFAATAATIVAGTVAERCKMAAYLCYSLFLTGFVYPIVVRSIWSTYGFISAFNAEPLWGIGNIDFAGSGVVHMTGGATALVAAIILGPRRGRFYDDDGNALETPVDFPGHSAALQVLGTFILWFGWFGFNPGSALAIANEGSAATAALCAVTTTLAAATGCVTSMGLDSIIEKKKTGEVSYDLTMAMNGALGGLVAITAGCSVVYPWAAVVIGFIGGIVYYAFSKFLIMMKIDDAVDAIPVHFANGAWGVIAVGLFAAEELQETAGYSTSSYGLLLGGGGTLLGVQVCAVLWICAWVFAVMTPFFYALNMFGMFRVDALEEEVGLDISHHRGAAYDLTGAADADVAELLEVRASKHGKVEVPEPVADAAAETEKP